MIKNNKGFMLIEVIITSTIVLTTLIALYASFNKLYNNYRIKNNYHNLDATYATKEIINSMLKNDEGNINNYINTIIPNSKYGYIIKNGYCTNEAEFNNNGTPAATVPNNCSNIKKLYTINNMLFVEYDSESLNELDDSINQTFKEYVDYVIKYYDIKNTKEDYNYIYLTEIKNGDNYYYANLRMR